MGKWSHVASFIWCLARLVFGLILTWRIHSVVENVGILKFGARKSIALKTVMSLKSDSFSVFFLVSALLAIWVTHSSVKLNVKHIFFLESKNMCWQRQSILLKTYFYLDHNSLQLQDYFKSKLTSSWIALTDMDRRTRYGVAVPFGGGDL